MDKAYDPSDARGVKKVLGVLGGAAFAMLMLYATSWTVRGCVATWHWDGNSKLECYGSTIMDVHGKKGSGSIDTAGNCEIKIQDCEIDSVVAGGNAKVVLINGRVSKLQVAGNADVEIRGTQVGMVDRGGNARVHGLPEEDAKQAAEDLSRRYGKDACAGMIECYTAARAFGQIKGRLLAHVGADGHMLDATYEGDATPPIRECLVKNMHKKVIAGYDGKPGMLSCEYAGTIAGGSRQLMIGGAFQR
jgi:hypothetical protein